MKQFIFLLLIPRLLQSLTTCCGASVSKNNNILIQEICKHTSYYNLCISSLESDPRSSNADVKGLALVSVELLLTKANETLKHVGDLFEKVVDPLLYRFYGTCIEEYRAIVERQIPEAIAALKVGNYLISRNNAEAAVNHVETCEEQFAGKSPLTVQSQAVHDLSLVATKIIELLG